MKIKIITLIFALMLIAMALAPFSVALNWEPKNNTEKFQIFEVLAAPAKPLNQELEFIPSEEAPNKVVAIYNENMPKYTIIIGDYIYKLGVDFAYTSSVKLTLWEPTMPLLPALPLTPSREIAFTIKYLLDFSAFPNGIEGTLEMQLIAKGDTIFNCQAPGAMTISSLKGTGDLQNVNIKATSNGGFTQIGVVSGWPDIPPA